MPPDRSFSLGAIPPWTESPFYLRLRELADQDADARDLLGKVDHIAGQSAAIAGRVVQFLPQYTDHGERHLYNVLGFMGHLAGAESIRMLTALECALAIMAAMTHDLGMVLPEGEQAAVTDSEESPTTPEGKAWQTYRDGHPLWHAYRRLDPAKRATDRARQMLGQVKADFIRDSHAKELRQSGYHRIGTWLDILANGKGDAFYQYRGFPFRDGLAYLAMSHGQPIDWLPGRLAHPESPYADIKAQPSRVFGCGSDEVNWAWLSWLLRLADVMDCDASRTPRVLFESIGITDTRSQGEWKKHLSIPKPPRFGQGEDGETLIYNCPCCPDPFTEKALLQILEWINDEITKVRHELQTHARHFPSSKPLAMALPSRAALGISVRQGNYEYLDLHFRLDRGAVMELLMGEALYGEPDLALRELVQNSLDALHLRDLRLRLDEKLQMEGRGEVLPVPVAALNPSVEPLEVQVLWGAPADTTGRPWIEVADNGVGMTREVIERFLTQIGKSYYKSPEFLRERELMRRHGLLCTTISQFGIGFLSAFMLAEDIEIETRAVGPGGGLERGWRVKIHGAHGLIALYPLAVGRVRTTGTRVRLTLKPGLALEPFHLTRFHRRLRKWFHDESWPSPEDTKRPKGNLIEPGWSVARCIVWPLWPVKLRPPGSKEIALDDGFHAREVLPLDVPAIRAKADEWTYPPETVGEPRWSHWDWVDVGTSNDAGTGSRIRLTVPWHTSEAVSLAAANDVPGRLRRSELLSLTEPQLPNEGRTLMLVNGMLVPEWKLTLAPWLAQVGLVGSCLWLDIRGEATPRLRADRRAPTTCQEVEGLVQAVQRRFHEACGQRSESADRWVRLAIAGLPPLLAKQMPRAVAMGARLARLRDASERSRLVAASLIQEREVSHARERDRNWPYARDHALTFPANIARGRARAFGIDLVRARAFGVDLARALALACELASDPDLPPSLPLDLARDLDRYPTHDLTRDLALADVDPKLRRYLAGWLQVQDLPEALQPGLGHAFAPWSVPGWKGHPARIVLGGPLVLRYPPSPAPDWAGEMDLLVPMTGHPLGELARRCPRWASERGVRPVFTLPFVLGSVPPGWTDKADKIVEFLGVDSLLAFIPGPEHWDKAFSRIPEEDFGHEPVPEFVDEHIWRDAGATALWDIKAGTVLWAEKYRTRAEMRSHGLPLDRPAEL